MTMLMKRTSREGMPEITKRDYKAHQEQRHRNERSLSTMSPAKRFLARTAIGVGVGLLPFGMYLRYDVAPERERLSQTQPEIVDIYEANDPAENDVGVIVNPGLGVRSAEQTATSLPSLAQLGEVMAVVNDNRGIDSTVLAREIEETFYEKKLESLIIDGHSMGGDVALQVARYLYEETDVAIDAIILDCTPPTIDTVWSDEREKGMLMSRLLPYIPGGDVARSVRAVVEMGARQDRYFQGGSSLRDAIDTDAFIDAAKEVYRDKIRNQDAASNGLIESQFKIIVSSQALDNLAALGEAREGKTPPAIIYMRPKDATSDAVVDVENAQRLITDQVGVFSGRLLIVELENTGHANPNQRPTEYNAAISSEIVPFMERRQQGERKELLAQSVLEGLGILRADE